jgi:glucose-1-phosphate adenylyltransferase
MIFEDVIIEEGAIVRDSIIMPGAHVCSGAVVEYAIIGEGSYIGENAVIGARPENIVNKNEWGIAVVGHKIRISPNSVVLPKQIISESM